MTISFAGRVAIVTGAGGGLGRAYALELARRGAKVVVNDLGGARDGIGASDAAERVVAEILSEGGEAMAHGGSVSDYAQMQDMVAQAKARWGGVHILINNAGILRDKSFLKMAPEDFEMVVKVHLIGAAFASKACWEVMREQGYGRILMTTSSSGLFGNFGQSNYAAAKAGLVGLAKTLYLEGARYDIRVNAIAPLAATRMTEDIYPEQVLEQFKPENVVPAALFLVSEDAPTNAIVGAAAGGYHASWISMNQPVILSEAERTVEGFAANWDRISRRENILLPQSGPEQGELILAQIASGGQAGR
ncbi:SDR family NAD(P)-dependent oxidoreductase [Tsuneonella sp. CC-YZS046]|uniref:SDR family NAD(P)-dependent oxidoreductase n=1 Tax=Tsuneonella sp. CC-YZS046 TaxID=3042152 RepID=UPI002D76EDE0|nr:SDR family NAD(P)-dependent oxidoreductase [Tsuneonella sp. CC-YZS046]WRO65290.1 SDR family NAD(P)-dependent oxidoreductase [Tsuneonella sp. CC-YZS046]